MTNAESHSTERFRRQTILPEVGEAGQQLLGRAHVLVVGAGGLGSPALLYLAAAGVGQISVIDGDVVELSNLQRQVLFTTNDLGRFKAEVAAEKLRALNPATKVNVFNERLSAENILRVFDGVDCIVDGTDNFSSKFLINDAAVKTGKPLVYGSILRFEGQVSVFNYEGGPCYRCLYPEAPKGVVMNCAEAGVLGAVAGLVGSMQALETIKVLLEKKAPTEILSGALLTIDGLMLSTRRFKIAKRADCPVCSKAKSEVRLVDLEKASDRLPELPQDEATSLLGAVPFIDVREPKEWAGGTIPGALLWPLSRMEAGELPNVEGRTILYCQSGVRSQRAGLLLKDKTTQLTSLRGGFAAWPGPVAVALSGAKS